MIRTYSLVPVLVTATALLATGCFIDSDPPSPPRDGQDARDDQGSGRRTSGGDRRDRQAPRVENIQIPEWPPIGPDGEVTITLSDDRELHSAEVTFHRSLQRRVFGKRSVLRLTAEDLGEGFGTMSVRVRDLGGWSSERRVANLLVDLTPPTIELERDVVSTTAPGLSGEIGIWVRDAFVLGSVELTFEGKTIVHEFPRAYPSTLGKAWDVSRVGFSAKDLPEGDGTAVIIARDAAGNATTQSVRLRLDGTAPVVAIASPAPNTQVSGPFDVVMSASDPGSSAAAEIDVYIGGGPAATLVGPNARLTIDPATLPKGPVEIRAIARDEAGNASEAASVTVVVP